MYRLTPRMQQHFRQDLGRILLYGIRSARPQIDSNVASIPQAKDFASQPDAGFNSSLALMGGNKPPFDIQLSAEAFATFGLPRVKLILVLRKETTGVAVFAGGVAF